MLTKLTEELLDLAATELGRPNGLLADSVDGGGGSSCNSSSSLCCCVHICW